MTDKWRKPTRWEMFVAGQWMESKEGARAGYAVDRDGRKEILVVIPAMRGQDKIAMSIDPCSARSLAECLTAAADGVDKVDNYDHTILSKKDPSLSDN